jgi:hypothetical protein
MISRFKIFVAAGSLLVIALIGMRLYGYFFDTTVPVIALANLQNDGWYSGDISVVVSGTDGYKVADISVQLDGKPLVTRHRINRDTFEYTIPLATKTLTQGKHQLRVDVCDASYHRNTATETVSFFVDNTPLTAALVKNSDYRIFQGRTLHIQFQVNKEIQKAHVTALSEIYPCVPETPNSLIYECFVPIKSDETPNEYLLSIDIQDRVGNTIILENKCNVILFPFKRQNLAVNHDKFKKEQELGRPQKELEDAIALLTAQSPREKLWQGVFYIPCEMRGISTDYGTLRTTQERGKYPHNAVDILGTPRSVIWASQDGVVVLKDRFVAAGNTIVIDHGCGVFTLYFHLENFGPVSVGDKIKKGNPIGTLGMTGYASGYHLHWELRVNNIAVDPVQWTRHDF